MLLHAHFSYHYNAKDFLLKLEITVEREAQFGILDMGSEKELQIEIRNIDGIEHVLLDAKFINLSSNFEIRNNSFPVVVPVEGKISIGVHFKSVIYIFLLNMESKLIIYF